MRKIWRRFWTALMLFLIALGAAFAEPRAPRDPYREHAQFSMEIDGITVKNQAVLMGADGKTYAYGDTCRSYARGSFLVLQREKDFVLVRYSTPISDIAKDECPSDTVTTLSLRYLHDRMNAMRARQAKEAEDRFMREFRQQSDE